MGVRYWPAVALLLPVVMLGCTSQLDPDPPSPPKLTHPHTTSRPGTSKPKPAPSPTLAAPELRKYCHPGNPLVGVYSPWRLAVKSPCAAVTGVVADTNIEHDGDLHISLADVDPQWLNEVNLRRAHQDLVVEAVPELPMPRPAVGANITVIGPWVLDTQTGWLEIHPVWTILPAG